MPEAARRLHWVVPVQYRMRGLSFAATFAGFAAQMSGKGYSEVVWALLALQFLVYPHLLYWHACRAANPLRTELRHLPVDSALLGIWAGVIGLPLWITFTMYVSTTVNNTVSRGWRGALVSSGVFVAGALAMTLPGGPILPLPETDPIALALCVALLPLYLMAMGDISYYRNKKLREARQNLEQGELALLAANEALRAQLAEIDKLHNQLREQANRDSLTGLWNRRYLDSTLERELSRCKREGRPLALLMMDLDHFKQVNDTYGHAGGDEVLKQLGALLATHARAEDVPCRYGGEEFTLLLPNMPLDAAVERAEMLRTTFAAMKIRFGDFQITTTLSVGLAVYPEHGKLSDELTQRADRALYRAKVEGRNRVIVFDGSMAATGT
jgi:diguanylate cyclase (GGDEF)-like protein